MSEEFLSPDELLKRLVSFKEKWFGIAEKSEALSNYKSGFDADFEKAISDIYQRVKSCRKDIELISLSVEHHIPKARRRIKGLANSIIDELDNFRDTLQQDIKALKDYDSLRPKLIRLEREVTEVDKRFEMVSELAERAYNEYVDAKNTYEGEVQKIKGTTNKILVRIKEKFVFDFDDMFGGFDLVTKDDMKKIDPQTLFRTLIKDADFAEKIDFVPEGLGGLIGGKRSELEIRKTLLGYKAKEINKEIRPVLEDEKKKLRKLEPKIADIEELKKAAQRLDEEKGDIEQEKEGVKKKVDKLRFKGEEVMSKFLDYEDILDLREGYLQGFNEINTERRKLFKLIEDALKAYEPPEPDLEKRELIEEIRTLTKEKKKYEETSHRLKKEQESITKKYKSTRAILTKKSKEIGKVVASIKERETKIKGLEDEAEEITRKLEATSQRLSLTQKKLEDNVKKSRKKIKEQRAAYASLEIRYKKKLREAKVLNTRIKNLLKTSKRTGQSVNEEMEEEEQIVSEKIEALRKRDGV